MKSKIQHIERRGLPGGPNEQFTYITGIFSTDGYRSDSPDVDNPFNVIPSGRITMKEKDGKPLKKGPILGIDNLGNQQMMIPGNEYQFPGTSVTEIPQMQFGGMSKRKVDKILSANKDLNFVQRLYEENTPSIQLPGEKFPSTHLMESADDIVYPTIIQKPDGTLEYLGDKAYDYAIQSGEYIKLDNERQARRFAENYKKGTNVLKEFAEGGDTTCPQGMYWNGKTCVPYFDMSSYQSSYHNTTDNTRVATPIVPPQYRGPQAPPKPVTPKVPKKVYQAPANDGRLMRPNTQIVADNTRVVLPPPPPPTPAPAYREATISQYTPPSTFDYVLNKLANPMTTIGYVVRGQDIPDIVRPKDNAFDYAMDVINPAAWVDYGLKAIDDYSEGDLVGGTLNALGAIPAVGVAGEAASALKPFVKPAVRKTLGPVFNAALDLKYGANTPAVQFERQMGRVADMGDIRVVREATEAGARANPIKYTEKLATAADDFDNVIQSRVNDLSTPEGMARLKQQEAEYLQSINYGAQPGEDLAKQARYNALARYNELKKITTANRNAANITANPDTRSFVGEFVVNSSLWDNAYYRKPNLVSMDNYLPENFVQTNGLDIRKFPQLGGMSIPGGELGLGFPYLKEVPVMHHEIGHALQRGRVLPIDKQLKAITPAENLNATNQRAYDYFKSGSSGQESSAFANELRASMMQRGLINNIYDEITPELLQKAKTSFSEKPLGVFIENPARELRGKFHSNHRLLDFMAPTPENYKTLSGLMNKLPATVPIGIGIGAGSTMLQSSEEVPQNEFGGELDKYPDGGPLQKGIEKGSIYAKGYYTDPLTGSYVPSANIGFQTAPMGRKRNTGWSIGAQVGLPYKKFDPSIPVEGIGDENFIPDIYGKLPITAGLNASYFGDVGNFGNIGKARIDLKADYNPHSGLGISAIAGPQFYLGSKQFRLGELRPGNAYATITPFGGVAANTRPNENGVMKNTSGITYGLKAEGEWKPEIFRKVPLSVYAKGMVSASPGFGKNDEVIDDINIFDPETGGVQTVQGDATNSLSARFGLSGEAGVRIPIQKLAQINLPRIPIPERSPFKSQSASRELDPDISVDGEIPEMSGTGFDVDLGRRVNASTLEGEEIYVKGERKPNLKTIEIQIPQKADGGELEQYKKYINGEYENTPEEMEAKRIYDKLNRVYYKAAKDAGMSAPNYIMSTLLTL